MARTQVPYPLFAHVAGERVVVVGAGPVAERKVADLVVREARVTVVAPDATAHLRGLSEEGSITWKARPYRDGDLDGALLAVAATSDRALNGRVSRDARARHILVNVVDEPDLCTFTAGSVMRRGQLQVAVSTNGASPATARDIRRSLEAAYPAWWEAYVDLLADVRRLVRERVPDDAGKRASLCESLAAAGLGARVAQGDVPDAEAVYAEIARTLDEGGAR